MAHPLDPLSAAEIRHVAAALRARKGVDLGWRFASIDLAEPAKEDLTRGATDIGRAAHVICWNPADGQAYRAMVSLPAGDITQWEHLPGIQPNMTVDEWHECDEMLRRHPQLIDALARRGITDMSLVLTDVWAYGAALVPARYRGVRLGWADVWERGSADGNPYAHHITGLHPVVDLNRMELLELEDNESEGGADRPDVMGEYLPGLIPTPLREVSPLHVQSARTACRSRWTGGCLRWQNWELRLGFNYREGLVLHTVGFRDAGRLRPIAHRMSFAEMIVPYRDATPDHYRRTAFDIGEWGLGFMTTSLDARLRLPRRDPLPGRGGARLARRAAYDPQRDLHPRGGRRHLVEARRRAVRRGGPASAQAGDLVPRDRGQLRVPGLLALLSGREHRVRGAGHRDHGDVVFPGRQPATDGRARRPANLRPLPPALHRGPARPGHRRPAQHRVCDRVAAHCRSATPTRTGWRW